MTTLWTSPDAPGPQHELLVRDDPDPEAWVASLDQAGRLDLHGRVSTQLLRDEPVGVLATGPDGWVEVAVPWQPAPEHPDGYHGWLPAAHLSPAESTDSGPEPDVAAERLSVLAEARTFLGLQYLWGGMSPLGLDCSGLVHYAHRRAGVIVPRDAYAQHAAAEVVPLGEEQPGDLYFFARAEGPVYHVGFVTGRLQMLHAPETAGGGRIEDAPLPPDRTENLVAAGRLLQV